ncbi:MAG: hypothetical protein DDT29_01407 [Dehalococcoidia bacterium]|nr:hypothetical protein [Bacillota bacterium]
MNKALKQGIKFIYEKYEREYGGPLPKAFRARVEEEWEEDARLEDEDDDEIPEDEDDDEIPEDEVKVLLSDFNAYLGELFEKVELLGYFSSREKPKKPVSRKRYGLSFENHLSLVGFVLARRPYEENSFILRKRLNWKQVWVEWKERNPHDSVSLKVLKVRYYRAIADEDIQREYYRRRYHAIADLKDSPFVVYMFNSSLGELSQLMMLLPPPPPDGLARLYKEKDITANVEAWREAHPATTKWQQVSIAGGSKALVALNKVWYLGGTLAPDEETLLRQLHDQYTLEQPNFKTWLEQTLRQLFENSLDEDPVVTEKLRHFSSLPLEQMKSINRAREAHHEGPHPQTK